MPPPSAALRGGSENSSVIAKDEGSVRRAVPPIPVDQANIPIARNLYVVPNRIELPDDIDVDSLGHVPTPSPNVPLTPPSTSTATFVKVQTALASVAMPTAEAVLNTVEASQSPVSQQASTASESKSAPTLSTSFEDVQETWIVAMDYEAQAGTDKLTIHQGDILQVRRKFTSGWWLASTCDGRLGWVPGDFLDAHDGDSDDAILDSAGSNVVSTAPFSQAGNTEPIVIGTAGVPSPSILSPSANSSAPFDSVASIVSPPSVPARPQSSLPTAATSRDIPDASSSSSLSAPLSEAGVSDIDGAPPLRPKPAQKPRGVDAPTFTLGRQAAEAALQAALNASGQLGGPRPRPPVAAKASVVAALSDPHTVIEKPVPLPRPPSLPTPGEITPPPRPVRPSKSASIGSNASTPSTTSNIFDLPRVEDVPSEVYIDLRDANVPQQQQQQQQMSMGRHQGAYELMQLRDDSMELGEYRAAKPVSERFSHARSENTSSSVEPETYETLPVTRPADSAPSDTASSPAQPPVPLRPQKSKLEHLIHLIFSFLLPFSISLFTPTLIVI